MTSRDLPTHPVTEEQLQPKAEEQPKGVIGKVKEVFGLGGGPSEAKAGVSERSETYEKEHAEASKERVAGPGTPGRAGPVCAPSQVGGRAAAGIRGRERSAGAASRGVSTCPQMCRRLLWKLVANMPRVQAMCKCSSAGAGAQQGGYLPDWVPAELPAPVLTARSRARVNNPRTGPARLQPPSYTPSLFPHNRPCRRPQRRGALHRQRPCAPSRPRSAPSRWPARPTAWRPRQPPPRA